MGPLDGKGRKGKGKEDRNGRDTPLLIRLPQLLFSPEMLSQLALLAN